MVKNTNRYRPDGYRVIREFDNHLFERIYKTKQDAQNWIDEMVDMMFKYGIEF